MCCGTKSRREIVCRYGDLIEAFVALVHDHNGEAQVLRTYWYDGARREIPTADHLQIASLPYVKLRLGRLSGGKQKGVDALIYRDLMTLARERAISVAYLLAGDEDLRLGVVEAQDLGVQVVLLGIPSTERNQSEELIREADEHVLLDREFLTPYFERRGAAAPAEGEERSPDEVGVEFGRSWAEAATSDELHELLGQAPRIPPELDVQMLLAAEQELGTLREREDARRVLRRGFWRAVQSARADRSNG